MEWGPKLVRETSCTGAGGLDVFNLCNSRRRIAGFSRRFEDSDFDGEFEPMNYYPAVDRSPSRLRTLWRTIVKQKRRILNSSGPVHAPYDLDGYEQNFDEGSAWVEPENLSRSFSARFAKPSRVFKRMA